MGLARDTVRGAMWTISAGMGARAIGLVSTLVITRFVSPADYGEVTVAAVVVMTANQISTLGFGQFLVANPEAPRGLAFHVTVFHVGLGIVAAALVLAVGGHFGTVLDAPGMTRFIPGLVLSGFLDRIGYVPERVLVRDLRFGGVSAVRTAGELSYSVACITLAALGFGGAAIVLANVVRSVVRTGGFVVAVHLRDWLEPCRLSLQATRQLVAFGLPMSFGALCAFAARRWDNLLVSHFFGPGPTGMYNLAYNLADVPAIQVGEQIGDVLLPSFARIDAARRPAALIRSIELLALVVFPLAVGLGAVAPTLVATVFDARWQSVGPMLVLLSALSVTRPIGWTIESYLQARQMPRLILALESFKVVALLVFIVTVGRISPLWTCAAVGLAFGAHTFAAFWVVRKIDGVSLRRSVGAVVPALAACATMAVVILAVRHALDASGWAAVNRPAVRLVLEVAVGIGSYAAAALFFARDESADLLARVFDAVRSRA
jgi:lipopolysaccharide exporter